MSVYILSAQPGRVVVDRTTRRVGQALVALLLAMVALAAIRPGRPRSEGLPVELERIAASPEVVEVTSLRIEREAGYAVVTGAVRNTTGRSVPAAEVGAQLLDNDEGAVAQASSLLQPEALPPGGTGTFRILCAEADRALRLRLTVREVGGPVLGARPGPEN